MSLEQQIYKKLEEALQPQFLEVVNQSHLHAGHAGDDGSGESHFKIVIQSDQVNKLKYVERERTIHKILQDEINVIHALSLKFVK